MLLSSGTWASKEGEAAGGEGEGSEIGVGVPWAWVIGGDGIQWVDEAHFF